MKPDHVLHSIVENGIHMWECSCGARFLPNQEKEANAHVAETRNRPESE